MIVYFLHPTLLVLTTRKKLTPGSDGPTFCHTLSPATFKKAQFFPILLNFFDQLNNSSFYSDFEEKEKLETFLLTFGENKKKQMKISKSIIEKFNAGHFEFQIFKKPNFEIAKNSLPL